MRRRHERILELLRRLPEGDQETLLTFAEFLAARQPEVSGAVPEPRVIPRPQTETVVGAIKRLSATYYMLDKATILNQTSDLMGQHVLHGRPARDVIDDLEGVFRQYYQSVQASGAPPKPGTADETAGGS